MDKPATAMIVITKIARAAVVVGAVTATHASFVAAQRRGVGETVVPANGHGTLLPMLHLVANLFGVRRERPNDRQNKRD